MGVLAALLALVLPTAPILVTPNTEAREAQATVAGGRIYVTYGLGDAIGVAVSEDGKTFAETGRIKGFTKVALGRRRGPRITVVGNTVVVTAVAGANVGHVHAGVQQDGNLLSWRSSDGGKTWDKPVQVNDVADAAREGLHAMTARPDGRVVCAWLDLRSNGTQLFASQSTDGGRTWSKNRVVYRRPTGSICECCHPSLVATPTHLYAMFRNSAAGARDMYYVPLTDDLSPVRAEKLGRGTWPLDACPMDGGSIAVGSEGVRTVWRRDNTVYYCRPGKAEVALGDGEQPWIATVGKSDYIVWLERRGGRLVYQGPGSEKAAIAEKADDPVVATDGQTVVTLWTEPAAGIRAAVLKS